MHSVRHERKLSGRLRLFYILPVRCRHFRTVSQKNRHRSSNHVMFFPILDCREFAWKSMPMILDYELAGAAMPRRSGARVEAPGSALLPLVGFLIAIAPIGLAIGQGNTGYYDDTHEPLVNEVAIEVVDGAFGYEPYLYSRPADGERLALDIRNATFVVANSQNANPTAGFDCDSGSLPVNRYPLKVYDPDFTSVVGGIIHGEVPQESDWKPTYCNSAAVIFKRAPSSTVDGLRITSSWDALRAGPGSSGLTIKNSWISNVRDDAVENDDFLSMTFEDNLVDGAFQGISIHSGGDITTSSRETIHLDGNVIRIREYLYKGGQRYGALFKNETTSPSSVIHNTVVAVDYRGGDTFGSYWERTWSKIDSCSNNLFLWLSDEPISSAIATPPACFTVLKGEQARSEWARAKQNWIDCHPKLARAPGDPASNPDQCVSGTFGGYSKPHSSRPLPPVFVP